MAKKLTADAANKQIGESWRNIFKIAGRLPDDVDVEVVTLAALAALENPWNFARRCRKLPISVVTEVVARLTASARDLEYPHRQEAIFISMICAGSSSSELGERWERALGGISDLNCTYSWGSKQRKQKIASLVSDSVNVAAIQAVAVGCDDASLHLLAALAFDATEASLDALLPHLDRAENDGPRLRRLKTLRTHAGSEKVEALLDRLDKSLEERSSASGACQLARQIGLGDLKKFWFRASISSTELNRNNVSRYQGHVSVDSRNLEWFNVSISYVSGGFGRADRKFTSFNSAKLHSDSLERGRCDAADIPKWFADFARDHSLSWSLHLSSNVRGKKRQQLADWLVPDAD